MKPTSKQLAGDPQVVNRWTMGARGANALDQAFAAQYLGERVRGSRVEGLAVDLMTFVVMVLVNNG